MEGVGHTITVCGDLHERDKLADAQAHKKRKYIFVMSGLAVGAMCM